MPYSKVSLLGVDSLWGDCIFIPANPQHKHAKWPSSDLTTWALTLIFLKKTYIDGNGNVCRKRQRMPI